MMKAGHILLVCCAFGSAHTGVGQGSRYDLADLARRYTLPEELLEISGLTDVDANTVACLQDESATLYFIDLASGGIIRRMPFGAPGDYEGLTRVGELYFALRSDGLIHRLRLRDGMVQLLDTFRLAVPNHNIEGLGFDEARNHVLVAPKDLIKGDKGARDERVLYAFDPTSCQLLPDAVLRFSITGLIAQAKAMGINVPMRTNENGRLLPALKLRLSSVAAHPVSGHYYLLSAVDHALVVLDRDSRLVSLHVLDPQLFPKPEGITFLASGDMLVSNEGKDARPNMLRFNAR